MYRQRIREFLTAFTALLSPLTARPRPPQRNSWHLSPRVPSTDIPTLYRPLLKASQQNRPIEITYLAGSSPESPRTIIPANIFTVIGYPYTYLAAFCLNRQAHRTFRLDKIHLSSMNEHQALTEYTFILTQAEFDALPVNNDEFYDIETIYDPIPEPRHENKLLLVLADIHWESYMNPYPVYKIISKYDLDDPQIYDDRERLTNNRDYFRTCVHCQQLFQLGHMDTDLNCCHSCASRYHNVVF